MGNQKSSIRLRLLVLAGALALIATMALGAAGIGPAATRTAVASPPSVESWVTDLSTSQRLAAQPLLSWQSGTGSSDSTIVVDPTRRYQTMTGFGAAMTDTSAWLLSAKLSPATRRQTMTELFSSNQGIGLSMLRQPMGASDFAVNGSYSYDDQPRGSTDRKLADFSIDHDQPYILPRLRESRRLNSKLVVMATPWSAPGWMKDSDSMITGSLKREYYRAYAQYFVKFLTDYRKAGVPVRYVSVQNEPLYEPSDYPGMSVPAADEAMFISRYLGPAIKKHGLKTQILGYDHNWDVPAYPEQLYDSAAARYVPGTAWHCYAGDVTAQSVSHNDYPHAQAFMTECSGGEWQGTAQQAFGATMALMIGGPRNWGQSVVLWNLALDPRNGPTNGGCQTCRGVVTVNVDGTVHKEVDYWALGQASKFVRPGAVRIASSSAADSAVANVAFANRDGSQVLVAYNSGSSAQTYTVQVGKRHFTATLAAGAAATYRWAAVRTHRQSTAAVGWLDLHFGHGPAGTPGGRLTQSVSPAVIAGLNQVRLGNQWLAYSQPFGAQLRPAGQTATLSRAGWKVTASSSDPASPVGNMIDGDLATRWSSGAGQSPGMWVALDLGAPHEFNQVVLDSGSSPGDYVRSYQVETSTDGTTWTAIARGQGSTGAMTIPLPTTTTRYLRLVSEGSSGSWWSIHELNLRTSSPIPSVTARHRATNLIWDRGRLDQTTVIGAYNRGRHDATVALPVAGFGYTYRLPPTAAVTFAVWAAG